MTKAVVTATFYVNDFDKIYRQVQDSQRYPLSRCDDFLHSIVTGDETSFPTISLKPKDNPPDGVIPHHI